MNFLFLYNGFLLLLGDGDGDYDYTIATDPGGRGSDPGNRLDVSLLPTTYTVTRVQTVYATVPHSAIYKPGGPGSQKVPGSGDGGASVPDPQINLTPGPGQSGSQVRPTPVIPEGFSSTDGSGHLAFNGTYLNGHWTRGVALPRDEFLVRTVLHSNMTIIHNRIEHFKDLMEEKLTRAYKKAYQSSRCSFKKYFVLQSIE